MTDVEGGNSGFTELELDLQQKLNEVIADRDSWRLNTQLAESSLKRILNSPAWKISKPLRVVNVIAWKIKPSLKHPENQSWIPPKSGENVYELVKKDVSYESEMADLSNRKIAILAHWSESEKLSASVERTIDSLIEAKYSVILVSSCESVNHLSMKSSLKNQITVIRKPNIGYDFGSWSTAIQMLPKVFSAEQVIIINDSLIGPFTSISKFIDELENSPYDVTGVTDSNQIRYHIQSFIMHFKNNSFQEKMIQSFWKEIHVQESKFDLVKTYEIGLSATAQAAKLYVGALYPWNLVGQYWENPSVDRWARLLELGFPFVKREVARESTDAKKNTLIPKIEKHYSVDTVLVKEINEALKA